MPTLTIISPTVDALIKRDSIQTISWGGDVTGSVSFELISKIDGSSTSLYSLLPSQGDRRWSVSQRPGDYTLKATSTDGGSAEIDITIDSIRNLIKGWLPEDLYTSPEAVIMIEALAEELQDLHADIADFPFQRSVTTASEKWLADLEYSLGLPQTPDLDESIRRRRLLTASDFIRIKGSELSFSFWFYYFSLRMSIVPLWTDDYSTFVSELPDDQTFYATPHFALEVDLGDSGYLIDHEYDYGDTPIPDEAADFGLLLKELNDIKPAETVLENLILLRAFVETYAYEYSDSLTEYNIIPLFEDNYADVVNSCGGCFTIGEAGVTLGGIDPETNQRWIICAAQNDFKIGQAGVTIGGREPSCNTKWNIKSASGLLTDRLESTVETINEEFLTSPLLIGSFDIGQEGALIGGDSEVDETASVKIKEFGVVPLLIGEFDVGDGSEIGGQVTGETVIYDGDIEDWTGELA